MQDKNVNAKVMPQAYNKEAVKQSYLNVQRRETRHKHVRGESKAKHLSKMLWHSKRKVNQASQVCQGKGHAKRTQEGATK